jgi:hypothetical protein
MGPRAWLYNAPGGGGGGGGGIFGSAKFYKDETYNFTIVVRKILYSEEYTIQSGLKI